MPTKYVYVQGKAKWARVNTPDPWGNFKISLYLTPSSLEEFKKLEVKNTIKKDEDGYYVVLRRPQSKHIKGKVVGFAPPVVVDSAGVPFRDLIGNGSDVTVKLDYYTYKSPMGEAGRAIRLTGVRVDNLVPYVPTRDMDEDDGKAVARLDQQPPAADEGF